MRQSLLPQGGEADRPGRPPSPEHRQSPGKGDGNRQDERGDLSISETSAAEKSVSPSGDSRTQIQAEAAGLRKRDDCSPSPDPSFRVAENKKDGESVCDSAGPEAQNPIQQQASPQSPALSRSPSPFPAPSSSPVKTAASTSVPVSTTPNPKEDPRPSESTAVGGDDAEAKSPPSMSPDPPAADPEAESQVPREQQRLSPPSSTADKEAEEASAEREDAARVAPSSPPVEAAAEAEAEALPMPSTSPSSESLSSSQKQPSSPSSTAPHSAAAAVAAPTTVASYPVTSSVSCPTVCDIRQSEEVKPASPEPEKDGKPTENSSSTPVAPCPPEQPLLQESLRPPTESSTGEDIPADKKEVSRVEVEDRRETSGGSGEIFATLTECSPPSDGAASKSADSQGEVRFS